jgi:hypothetical protein
MYVIRKPGGPFEGFYCEYYLSLARLLVRRLFAVAAVVTALFSVSLDGRIIR